MTLHCLSALFLLSGFGLGTANLRTMSEQYAGQATARTVTNTYDAAVRLDTEQITEADGVSTLSNYDYDDAGNRKKLTKTTGTEQVVQDYSYNSLNQLTGFTKTGAEAVSYTYDAKGNRATRTQGPQTDTYVWDAENRLKQIDHAATAKTYRYGYDHRTRRVIRQEGDQTTLVQHAGGTSLAEWTLPAGTVLPTVYLGAGSIGTATQSKVFIRGSDMGGGVGGLLYSEQALGTPKPTVAINSSGNTWTKTNISNLVFAPSLNHYNGRGDVVAKTDASGSVTWTGSYEAFGTRTRETGTNEDRQRANTKDEDPTGLLNEGMRYRDLETGTWLSRDPAGFVDGPNLYAYVRANPWSKFDPLGLEDEKPEVPNDTPTDVPTEESKPQRLPKDGEWTGTPGDSTLNNHPGIDPKKAPEGIPFKDGVPDYNGINDTKVYTVPEGVENTDAAHKKWLREETGGKLDLEGKRVHHFERNGKLELQIVDESLHTPLAHTGPMAEPRAAKSLSGGSAKAIREAAEEASKGMSALKKAGALGSKVLSHAGLIGAAVTGIASAAQGKNEKEVSADIVKSWSGADVLEDITNSATEGYISNINRLKEKAKKDLEE